MARIDMVSGVGVVSTESQATRYRDIAERSALPSGFDQAGVEVKRLNELTQFQPSIFST
jgi:hypothetical protein